MELLILLSFLLTFQQEHKETPPDENAVVELAKEIEDLDWFPKTEGGRLQMLTNALEVGQRAAKEPDDNRAWVIYRLAMKFADAAGENRIAHDFAHEMAERWNVPEDFLIKWYENAIEQTRNQARIAELTMLMVEDVKSLAASEASRSGDSAVLWGPVFKDLRKLANSAGNERTKETCGKAFDEIQAWLWVEKKAGDNDAIAFRSILSGDVAAGIKRLSDSADSGLAEIATKVAVCKDPFSYGHQSLLERLAESRNKAANLAGQKVFESLLPELTKQQIETCQPICYFMTEELPLRADYALPYYGHRKNGYHPFASELKLPKGYTFDDGKWSIEGSGSLAWPRLPFENYVQEMHVTVEQIESSVKLEFGVEDSNEVHFKKDGDAYYARLVQRVGSRNRWNGTLKLKYNQPLVVKIYRTHTRTWAFVDGRQLKPWTFGLHWHKFRLTGGKGSKISVSKIVARPWLPGDREALVSLVGEHKMIDLTAQEFVPPGQQDYRKYLDGMKNAGSRYATNEPFVTPFEIMMQPVPAGKFERPVDKRKVSISRDFHCSAHEINQLQFSEIMGFNPASVQGNPYLPVDSVTLDEAINFCKLLNDRIDADGGVPEGYEYRLPTEAEWTWASMTDRKSDMDVPADKFWNWDTFKGGYQMVGISSPSERGLFDMHGNVEELTMNKYHQRRSPEETKESEELVDPVSWPEYGKGKHIVIKGGSWNAPPEWSSTSWRGRRHPGRTPGRGFRVVLAPKLKLK
jgi:formylglycine-generating enzyme required for sulfatase activity